MSADQEEILSENEMDAPDKESVPDAVQSTGFQTALRALTHHYGHEIRRFIASREPRIGSAILAMLGVAILLSLGTWQVSRSQEKNLLLTKIEQELVSAPYNLSAALPQSPKEWEALHYKPVELTGTWMPLRSFRLAPRSYEDQRGYQWIIPFRMENGQVILINRGFVPDHVTLVPPGGNDVVTLHGVAFKPDPLRPRFVPENLPSKGEWVWLDLNAMIHEVGIGNNMPIIVYESRIADKNSYPIGGQVPLPFHNRHWHYAVTWYCLALALMWIWLIAIGPKPLKPNDNAEAESDASSEPMDPVARRGLYPEATD